MEIYSPSGKNYIHIAKIPKAEIEKIDFELLKQPRETLKNYYNRLSKKPDLITNLGFFSMADGTTCFNFIDEGKAVSTHDQYQWGMGIIGDKDLRYGFISSYQYRDFVSGFPNLIDGGEKVKITIAQELNYKARRTMLGYDSTNVYVICIDLPGANFADMQNLAVQIGCDYCINLDGGGSTRMLHKGKVVTNGVENRPVDTALAIYLKESVVENTTTNTTQGSVETMATYLKPDKTIKATVSGKTLTISQKIIPNGATASKYVCDYIPQGGLVKPNAKVNNGSGKPRGITVHNTAAIQVNSQTTMAEQYARATYPNLNMKGAVVHYYVSGYNEIWQLLNTDPGSTERGWHASDKSTRRKAHDGAKYDDIGGNLDTIAIECVGNSKEAEDATARLVAYLCKKHGLDPNIDVYTHNYFMGLPDSIVYGVDKNCPQYILPHWKDFLAAVSAYYKPTTSTPTQTKESFKVGEVVQYLGLKHYLTANAAFGFSCKPGKATVTKTHQIGKSKHPYHLKAVLGSGSTVNGWVDENLIKKITSNKFSPYVVSVTANTLNVRSGPGTSYKISTTVKKGEAFTIVEERDGWGKLKSGKGWISLSYTKKVQ